MSVNQFFMCIKFGCNSFWWAVNPFFSASSSNLHPWVCAQPNRQRLYNESAAQAQIFTRVLFTGVCSVSIFVQKFCSKYFQLYYTNFMYSSCTDVVRRVCRLWYDVRLISFSPFSWIVFRIGNFRVQPQWLKTDYQHSKRYVYFISLYPCTLTLTLLSFILRVSDCLCWSCATSVLPT